MRDDLGMHIYLYILKLLIKSIKYLLFSSRKNGFPKEMDKNDKYNMFYMWSPKLFKWLRTFEKRKEKVPVWWATILDLQCQFWGMSKVGAFIWMTNNRSLEWPLSLDSWNRKDGTWWKPVCHSLRCCVQT